MKELFAAIEEALKNSVAVLPLELSAFLGGCVEEIVAPIPSPFVMAAVGSAAFAQEKPATPAAAAPGTPGACASLACGRWSITWSSPRSQ